MRPTQSTILGLSPGIATMQYEEGAMLTVVISSVITLGLLVLLFTTISKYGKF